MTLHKTYKNLAVGPLNFPLPDSEARELEKLLDSGEFSKFEKFSSSLEATSPTERTDISIITDDSLDSDNEIFIPKGVNFDRFRKNPVVTYNHRYDIAPVGKSLWQKLIGENTWKAKTQYASRPEDFPKNEEWFPSSLFHLVKEGYLPGKSIAGISKFRSPTQEEISKNPGVKRVATDTIVYEYSVVNLNANKNAIVESVTKGIIGALPELKDAFPELSEIVKDEILIIKEFRTLDEYMKDREAYIQSEMSKLYSRTPEMVENAMARVMGKI